MSRSFPVPSASSPGGPPPSDSIEPPAGPISGATVGRYVLLFELAAGGMGSVFVGRQRGAGGFERLVAIKRMHRHVLQNPDLVLSFHEEARIASRVHHPNVVQVIDVYELNGEHMIVMEYVEGVSLSALTGAARRAEQPLAIGVAIRVAIDAARGLHAAHQTIGLDGTPLLVVHRDVSPQNLLIGVDGSVRVTDFGIARALQRLVHTAQGELKGKIRYMSPEQARSADIDHRSDVFSLGVVLWEMLTGKRLYQGQTELELLRQAADAVIEPPHLHRSELPTELSEILIRALAPMAEERYASAADFADALERWAIDTKQLATPAEVAQCVQDLAGPRLVERKKQLQASFQAARTGDSWPRTSAPHIAVDLTPATSAGSIHFQPKRRKLWWLGALAGAAALGALLLAITSTTQPELAAAPPRLSAAPQTASAKPEASADLLAASASTGASPTASATASASAAPSSAPSANVKPSGPRSGGDLRSNPYD